MNIFYINNITRDKPRSKINFSVINYFPVFLNSHACLPFFDVSFISINHLSKLKGSTSWLLLLTIFEVKNVIRKINVYFKKKKRKKKGREKEREKERRERKEEKEKNESMKWPLFAFQINGDCANVIKAPNQLSLSNVVNL